jgi:hypothetical protein
MRRVVLTLATAVLAAGAVGCGGADVVVLAQLEAGQAATGEATTLPLGAVPVRLLPYDRDALFDSLSQAHPVPEPRIPDTIFQLQQQVIERQQEWQRAQARWGALRDSLETMSNRMRQMDRRSGEYFALFREFNALADEVERLDRQSNQAFQQFTSLQSRLTQDAREIQIQRELWAEEAFAPIDSIIQARLDARGGTELVDTTRANGVARFRNVRPGRWWVHARFDRQFDELYWNLPIEVERGGEDLEIRLTEQNAEARPKL